MFYGFSAHGISKRSDVVENDLDGVHFRCDFQDLGHPWTDWDETLGVYRVDLEIMQRHIFDFRSEVKTGNGPFYP